MPVQEKTIKPPSDQTGVVQTHNMMRVIETKCMRSISRPHIQALKIGKPPLRSYQMSNEKKFVYDSETDEGLQQMIVQEMSPARAGMEIYSSSGRKGSAKKYS